MITAFRKFRQALLASGKIQKYLLYAAGEIFLVMIGILLALQVNNWNEAKKFAENESYTLQEILNNLYEDAEQIKFIIERREKANQSTNNLLSLLQSSKPLKEDNQEDVSTFLSFERYYPLNNAFEMMKSTGLKITNKPLRTSISRYYDFEQNKIAQSITDIESVIVRIFTTVNAIRSNIQSSQSGANMDSNITFKNINDETFRIMLLEELVGFRDNNGATLSKAIEFLQLNKTLIEMVNEELRTDRLREYHLKSSTE